LTAAPVLTLPASVTVGEDTLTEVSIGVNDDAVACRNSMRMSPR
jgi:hypothetical protein